MTKTTNEVVGVAAVVLGFAGFLAGLSSHPRLVKLSWVAMAVAAVLILWRIGSALHSRIRRARIPATLEMRRATREDIPELHFLLVREFGDQAPTLRQMMRWHEINYNIFHIVVEWNAITGKHMIVGGFKVVPLKALAVAALEVEAINGANLPANFIVKRRGTACAYYIGDVFSTSRRAGVMVMAALVDFMRKNLKTDMRVYARALTGTGLNYLRDFPFRPVGESDGELEIGAMCAIYPDEVEKLVERLHSGAPLRPSRNKRYAKKMVMGSLQPNSLALTAVAA